MISVRSRVCRYALMLSGVIVALFFFSAFHAYKVAVEDIRDSLAPPPFYGIRFVVHPNHYIDGAPELGFRPGWVVTFAAPFKTYGTAFFVSLYGPVLASGTPSIVTSQHRQAHDDLDGFRRQCAKLDAVIQPGMRYADALTILGQPVTTLTNDDGTLVAYFDYTPRAFLEYATVDWLTNGFRLCVSNGIVIQKDYSYTASH